jgi:hypothetical protein
VKPQKKFIIQGNQTFAVYELDDEHLVFADQEFKKADYFLYDNKDDAMYYKLVQELQNGKDITNFKSSPYYRSYLERLKIENPEYLI